MEAAADRHAGKSATLTAPPSTAAGIHRGQPVAAPATQLPYQGGSAYGLGEPVIFAQYAGTLSGPPAAAISLLKAAECLRALGLACS